MSRKSADFKITITGIVNINPWQPMTDEAMEGWIKKNILSKNLKKFPSRFLDDVDEIQLEVGGITEGYRYTDKFKQEMEMEKASGRFLKQPEVLAGRLGGN